MTETKTKNNVEYDNPWLWNGKPFFDAEGWAGMVYLITNLESSKRYVGKKFFWRKEKRKGRNRRTVSSDWRRYYGSSRSLLEDVMRLGKDKFKREILSLHPTRGGVNYNEVREQFVRGVLYNEGYYNDAVSRFQNINLEGSRYANFASPLVLSEGS